MEIKRFLQEISLEIDQLFGDSQDCLQAEVTASKTISMENVTDKTREQRDCTEDIWLSLSVMTEAAVGGCPEGVTRGVTEAGGGSLERSAELNKN